jgi:hypothetical protein
VIASAAATKLVRARRGWRIAMSPESEPGA